MDWLIGAVSVAIVCGVVGLLLFVLMHLMAASQQTTLRDELPEEEQTHSED